MSDMIPFESLLPSAKGWSLLKHQAVEILKSGYLPTAIKTPEQVTVIILKGRELGIPPMQSLSHIHVINGKPTMSAELMLALILQKHPQTKISFPIRTNKEVQCKVVRDGQVSLFGFSMDDATAAGLLSNPSWKKYPRAMLHARCVSEMARSLFPDAIAGVSYTPEELGAVVDGEGEIIDVSQTVNSVFRPDISNNVPDNSHLPPVSNETKIDPRIDNMLRAFEEIGIGEMELTDIMGKSVGEFTDEDFAKTREIYKAKTQ
jgi:hypothetical protein